MPSNGPTIISINAARKRSLTVGGKDLETGLFKEPIPGPVMIDRTGVPGDAIVNAKVHGGADQAVYLYSQEDMDWWSKQLQRDIMPGFFGENLTISHWWPDLRVGDQIHLGDLLLEVTAPRIPCAVMATRVGDPRFARAFVKAARCGAYTRVLCGGSICAGDTVGVTAADTTLPTVAEIFRYSHESGKDADFIRQCLAAPIAEKLRVQLEKELATINPDHGHCMTAGAVDGRDPGPGHPPGSD